jgi:hypothetical protein
MAENFVQGMEEHATELLLPLARAYDNAEIITHMHVELDDTGNSLQTLISELQVHGLELQLLLKRSRGGARNRFDFPLVQFVNVRDIQVGQDLVLPSHAHAFWVGKLSRPNFSTSSS